MSIHQMNGETFKTIITNGSVRLKNNMNYINDLNVFPVPDGDTGSNMSATMSAGAKAIQSLEDNSIGNVAKVLARGMLMGARGNSGVILSQLFSGIAKGLKGYDVADCEVFSQALRQGVEQAYAAVINPVEGTMLTVSREAADKAVSVCKSCTDFEQLFKEYVEELDASLIRTPDLLPVLKEVGVVDSGAAGYIEVVKGMIDGLAGKFYESKVEQSDYKVDLTHIEHQSGEDFGYCTEFIMQIDKMDEFNQKDFTEMIHPLGDSLVVVQDENILKVHIHTKTPGDALNLAQYYGFFINLKIENMNLQHTEVLLHQTIDEQEDCNCGHDHSHSIAPKLKKKYAIVAVLNGDGLKETFIEMGCDFIIEGGQTMNPSVEDFVNAINQIKAEHVIIIPNNKNVLFSAETAASVVEDCDVRVLKAKTISQGYAALTMFDATQDIDSNLEEMTDYIKNVKSGEVTYAIRDSKINGLEIKKNHFMGIVDGKLITSNETRLATCEHLLREMIDEDSEIVTVMYGEDVTPEEVTKLEQYVNDTFHVEVEVIRGDQSVYSYIITAE
ncbi:DAK2 domain-containing protein [Candidatus Izemoplasma sp. B36]|uniref:DAK2 domain-containing protein n=1 Tax=Candidatus Izemoplasma sp. B36 TaxID=3242468 RepID=UPI003555C861